MSSFTVHYRQGVFMAILPFVIIVTVITCIVVPSLNDSLRLFLLLASIAVLIWGTVRQYLNGHGHDWSSGHSHMDTSFGDGCASAIFGIIFSLLLTILVVVALSCIVWPFYEIRRQIRFLAEAQEAWDNDQILVDEQNQPVRGASYKPYNAQPMPTNPLIS